jgi:hypothetical protein
VREGESEERGGSSSQLLPKRDASCTDTRHCFLAGNLFIWPDNVVSLSLSLCLLPSYLLRLFLFSDSRQSVRSLWE